MQASAGENVRLLIEENARYWAGEYDIAKRFFGGPTSFMDAQPDLRWLTFQVHKEWYGSGVYGPRGVNVQSIMKDSVERLCQLNHARDFDKIDDVCSMLEFALDELKHYVLLGKLHQFLAGGAPLSLEDAGRLREGQELTELRYSHRNSKQGETAVILSEGGGLGLFFGIADAMHAKSELRQSEKALLHAVEEILRDERGHMAGNFRRAMEQPQSHDEWLEIGAKLRAISLQKLKERYQQFGFPLTDGTFEAALEGKNDWRGFILNHLGFLYAAVDLPHPGREQAPQLTGWLPRPS